TSIALSSRARLWCREPTEGLPDDSVALAFQLRAIPKAALLTRVRPLTDAEVSELELATDEVLGRVEPE
ncbi:MAG TPA: hypothetical protein VMI31_04490, partial [Fimbriimonadaceae bacterium]|nr:hypothetical protein [Fimbriimonadaceae bacterium]